MEYHTEEVHGRVLPNRCDYGTGHFCCILHRWVFDGFGSIDPHSIRGISIGGVSKNLGMKCKRAQMAEIKAISKNKNNQFRNLYFTSLGHA